MERAIVELHEAGVEPDIWKIEGLDSRDTCDHIARTCRRDGRDGVTCVVLGRGADESKVDDWLRAGAPVEGYAGFAIGRTIWWDAVTRFIRGELEREAAVAEIAASYRRFVSVYEEAAGRPAAL
jgi:myo-inositol catabolism protein IolC